MSGTKEGGKQSAETNKKKHGADFYARIGAIGGRNGHTGGFHIMSRTNPERHKQFSSIGGKISKRGPSRDYKLFGGKK